MAKIVDEEEFLSLAFDATVLVTCDEAGRFSARVLIGRPCDQAYQRVRGQEPCGQAQQTIVDQSIELVSRRMKDEYEIVPLGLHLQVVKHEERLVK